MNRRRLLVPIMALACLSTGLLTAEAGAAQSQPLLGWQINEANVGLKPKGLICNTLPLYSGADKVPAGTTISKKRVATSLDLSAGNILIDSSCIQPKTGGDGIALVTTTNYNKCGDSGCAVGSGPVTIRDSEIDGSKLTSQAVSKACAFGGVGNLVRNYIHDTGSGICLVNTGTRISSVIQSNYVTRLRAFGNAGDDGSHNESFTIRDFDTSAVATRRAIILNNRFVSMSGNDTGSVFLQAWNGKIDNVTVQGNLLESGGYQLILEASDNGYGQHMTAVNNRFISRGYGPGYVDSGAKNLNYGWASWQNNAIYSSTATGNKGKVVAIPSPS